MLGGLVLVLFPLVSRRLTCRPPITAILELVAGDDWHREDRHGAGARREYPNHRSTAVVAQLAP